MQYHIQSRFFWLRTVLVYGLVALLLTALEVIGITTFIKQWYLSLTRPIAQTSASSTFQLNQTLVQLGGMWSAYDELMIVRKENAVLQAEVAQVQSLKKENESLRALLGGSDNQTTTIRKRIGTIVGYASPTIVAQDGTLEVGELVLTENVLLGVILEVFDNQGKLQLLSSSKTLPILVQTESGVEGILTGNDRRVLMTDIPKDQLPKAGERVTTVGQEGIPASLFIGTIGEAVEAPTSPVMTYTLSQPVSFYNSSIVEIR